MRLCVYMFLIFYGSHYLDLAMSEGWDLEHGCIHVSQLGPALLWGRVDTAWLVDVDSSQDTCELAIHALSVPFKFIFKKESVPTSFLIIHILSLESK